MSYCDAYCICPKCGAGPDLVLPQYRHLYWPDLYDEKGNEKKILRK